MTFIFADPKKAMDLFVQRIFEERIKPAVERSAHSPDGGTLDPTSRPCMIRSELIRLTVRLLSAALYKLLMPGAKRPPLSCILTTGSSRPLPPPLLTLTMTTTTRVAASRSQSPTRPNRKRTGPWYRRRRSDCIKDSGGGGDDGGAASAMASAPPSSRQPRCTAGPGHSSRRCSRPYRQSRRSAVRWSSALRATVSLGPSCRPTPVRSSSG